MNKQIFFFRAKKFALTQMFLYLSILCQSADQLKKLPKRCGHMQLLVNFKTEWCFSFPNILLDVDHHQKNSENVGNKSMPLIKKKFTLLLTKAFEAADSVDSKPFHTFGLAWCSCCCLLLSWHTSHSYPASALQGFETGRGGELIRFNALIFSS